MATIAAVLIVKNEAADLPRCLASLGWVDEIVVVDDESTDDTVAIAEAAGAKVFSRKLDRFDTQRNFAIAQSSSDWILSIDADEEVSLALADEIRQVIGRASACQVYGVPFVHRLLGRWIRHGGWHQPLTRLYRRDAQWGGAVHEQVVATESYGVLRHPILHWSHETISEFIDKLNRYTDREAAMRLDSGKPPSRLKMIASPVRDFWRRYVRQRGYRDGFAGLVLAGLMAFYIFIARAKAWELDNPADEPAPLPRPPR